MITINRTIRNFTSMITRRGEHEFMIIPIVALVEGVHHGSGGRAFYSCKEIEKSAEKWNGVPLTQDHPASKQGQPIFAKDPYSVKNYVIGEFRNVKYKEGKLVGEGWVDVNKVQFLSPFLLEDIREGKVLEVSTGLVTKGDGLKGSWNGEEYDETVTEFIPDHLALLPGSVGACSFRDGCGIRANKMDACSTCQFNNKGGETNVKVDDEVLAESMKKNMIVNLKRGGYVINELTHSKLNQELRTRLGEMDSPGTMHFLRDVYDNRFVFEKITEDGMKLFQLSFKVSKNDEVTFKGEPKEVKHKEEFVVVNESNLNDKQEGVMDRKEQIDALIANKRLPVVTETDRGELEKLPEAEFNTYVQLGEKLINCKECDENEKQEDKKMVANEDKVVKTEETPAGVTVKTLDTKKVFNVKEEEKEKKQGATIEDILAQADPEMRESIEAGMAANKASKAKLISAITANKRNEYTADELSGMKLNELERVERMLRSSSTNYEGNRPPNQEPEIKANERQEDGSGVPDMETIDWNKAANTKVPAV